MQKLAKALSLFRVKIESVKKDANNPFFKSKYADLPSILEAIKLPLSETGLALVHNAKNSEGGYTLITTLLETESGEKIESEFPIFGTKPQEIGSSITYARRYNTLALLDIPTDDDDGNEANKAERTKTVDTPTGGTKTKTLTSPNEYCPECGEQCETKKGTTKEGRPYEMGTCNCGTKFFVNRKDLSNQPF